MSQQVGRNDPCPCGSGKKYKKCCADKAPARQAVPQVELNQLIGLFHAGRYPEVEGQAHALLARHPDLGLAWKILGTALGIQGKNALPAMQKAAQLLPNDAEVQYNFGLALQENKRLGAAADCFHRVIAIKPNDADAHNDLGNVFLELRQYEAAIASYRRAISLKPNFAEAHNKLGWTLHDLRQMDAALASFRKALAINPNYAEAHNNLGLVQQELGQLESALASYGAALKFEPRYAIAHNNLGNVLQALGQYELAVASFQRALEINPGYAEAYFNMGNALIDSGQVNAALDSYRRSLALKQDAAVTSSLIFALNFAALSFETSGLDEARAYSRMVAQQGKLFTAWRCDPQPAHLRVGVVSGDLCKHPVSYALESLLEQIDPARIELIAYPTNTKTDELTERLQRHFSAWHPIHGKSDQEAAELIHADGVHILLDLSGHTAHNRLPVFAWKPAPVQASWLGYFATTGVAEMDCLLTSEVAVPQAHRNHFTESIWYLPDVWLCFTPPALELPVNELPAVQHGHLTYGSFQRLDKISDAALSAWGKILAATPGAKLLLANKELGNATIAAQFTQRLQQQGIDPARVELQGAAKTRADYLARYHRADLILDTFPYPGVTTTCEALWMGVPTLSLAGETLLSRQGAGMLVPAGLGDWVANSEEEYIAKAIQFGSDLPKLAALRASLRQQVLASPVYDAPRFARNFEAALWDMWRNRA